MLTKKTPKSVRRFCGVALCLAAAAAAQAAEPVKLAGGIVGTVRDNHGVPQMGASVLLYNRQDRPVGKVLTDQHGQFQITQLLPSLYSIRVTLASFIPALRKDIQVQPGMRSVLNVSLSTLFSSIQLDYPVLDSGGIMTDEWKWVLRSASDTRPIMRFGPDAIAVPADPASAQDHSTVFSGTNGILRLSAGQGPVAGVASEADLGTAFAVATSLYGKSLLQVSGNLAYGSQTNSAAAFRTSYCQDIDGNHPVFSVTMRQLYVPGRSEAGSGSDAALPVLRSVSLGADNRSQLGDNITVQYGFTMDNVAFLDRLTYANPYARLTWAVNDATDLEFAYTSGNARPDLAQNDGAEQAELQQSLDTLGLFPRISMRNGHARLQRADDYEMAVTRHAGSRALRISAYREQLNNAALTVVGPAGMFAGSADVLPDLFSDSSVLNGGSFDNVGYTAALTQNAGDHFSATLVYGNEGALTARNQELVSETPDDLRDMIRMSRRHSATFRIKATVPRAGTRLIAGYQWTSDPRSLMGGNLYSAQGLSAMPGLNIYIRQPIPGFAGRLEATADLRNMLAQGYIPIAAADGASLLLVDNPRSFRGGLAFTF